MIRDDDEDEDFDEESEATVDTAEPDVDEPRKFAVILHNDDYTTMEFVIEVLTRFFHRSHDEAMQIMLSVHHAGRGVAGVYGRDIAETKAHQVSELARAKGFPLMCTVEPAQT